MSSTTAPAVLSGPLEGIDNFRDFGGYSGSAGRLRTAKLFRSGHHGRATSADIEALGTREFELVVDLRRPDEREREPSRHWRHFSANVISNDIANEETEAWISFVARIQPNKSEMHDYMLNYYRSAPFEPRHVDLFSRYFDALSRVNGPLIVHCSAGKDRTGILVALTQAVAGTSADDTMQEFLLTNANARVHERTPLVTAHLTEFIGRAPDPWVVRTALSVEPAYLDAAFGAIRERCGSINAYLSDVMKIDGSKRSAIETRILE